MAVAIARYYFYSVMGGVAPLLFSANSDSGSDAIFKVAVAHLCLTYNSCWHCMESSR